LNCQEQKKSTTSLAHRRHLIVSKGVESSLRT
jgi:hypothetical protein